MHVVQQCMTLHQLNLLLATELRNMFPSRLRICPNNALRRYFGTITTGYLHSHFTWAKLCHSLMTIPPCPSGLTSGGIVSFYRRNGIAFSSLTGRAGDLPNCLMQIQTTFFAITCLR